MEANTLPTQDRNALSSGDSSLSEYLNGLNLDEGRALSDSELREMRQTHVNYKFNIYLMIKFCGQHVHFNNFYC